MSQLSTMSGWIFWFIMSVKLNILLIHIYLFAIYLNDKKPLPFSNFTTSRSKKALLFFHRDLSFFISSKIYRFSHPSTNKWGNQQHEQQNWAKVLDAIECVFTYHGFICALVRYFEQIVGFLHHPSQVNTHTYTADGQQVVCRKTIEYIKEANAPKL